MQRFKLISGEQVYVGDRFISHGSGSIIELVAVDKEGMKSVVLLPALKIDSIFRIEESVQDK